MCIPCCLWDTIHLQNVINNTVTVTAETVGCRLHWNSWTRNNAFLLIIIVYNQLIYLFFCLMWKWKCVFIHCIFKKNNIEFGILQIIYVSYASTSPDEVPVLLVLFEHSTTYFRNNFRNTETVIWTTTQVNLNAYNNFADNLSPQHILLFKQKKKNRSTTKQNMCCSSVNCRSDQSRTISKLNFGCWIGI